MGPIRRMTLSRLTLRNKRIILCRLEIGVKSYGIVRDTSQTFHKAPQLLAPARMTQLAQGLGFNLANPFAGDFEILTDLFKGMVGGFADTKTLPQHFLFPW